MNKALLTPLAAALAALAVTAAIAAETPTAASAPAAAPAADAQTAAREAQLERIRQLRGRRPADGLLVFYEAMTLSGLGRKAEALDALESLAGRRLGLVPQVEGGAGFEGLRDEPRFHALRRRLWDEEPKSVDAPVVARLADARLIPEGIAHDAKRGLHYVGSIAQRKIVALDRRGRTTDFAVGTAAAPLDAMLGLAVDARRDRLCAVSTNGFEDAGRDRPRNAVLCWRLADRRLLARIEVPEARQLNDLAFAPDGGLYITDSAGGSLWQWQPERPREPARRVGAAGGFPGANGVAAAPDGSAVYVALSTGIARVDPVSGAAARMAQPDELVTGGIDGLYWHDGDLVGVQNAPNPGRVIRLTLADDGKGGLRIAALSVLQSHHHPVFAEPTTGAIVGGRLHVIANSHIGHYGPDGRLQRVEALRPTAIVGVPLRAAP